VQFATIPPLQALTILSVGRREWCLKPSKRISAFYPPGLVSVRPVALGWFIRACRIERRHPIEIEADG
jgi:hypothetical protein